MTTQLEVRPATETSSPPQATRAQDVRTEGIDEFADVADLFVVLRETSVGTLAHARAREAIVARCLGLADRVARHFDRRGEDLEDLVQVARVGLVNAVNRFDPDKGSSFVAFAIPTMMGEVRRHFRDHGWSMHVPRRLKDRHIAVSRATTSLIQDLGRAPTPSELAEYLDVDRDDVVESLVASAAYRTQSIDAPVVSGDGSARHIADTIGTIDAAFGDVTDRESVRPLLAALPEREREILYLRFFASMTQSQIAERIGVSQMHVSRILERTLRELRVQLS
ncbi:SigB/SigF/SigG family RNA polymerase sigma factor [Mycolicibacterium sp. 624]|uniref:SigB/SigF/SigG family RNA polymerase sigma factor n=1 Tax=Mycolicibacterium sp. 624 TaxID=3156314 RepID=UPI00339971D6